MPLSQSSALTLYPESIGSFNRMLSRPDADYRILHSSRTRQLAEKLRIRNGMTHGTQSRRIPLTEQSNPCIGKGELRKEIFATPEHTQEKISSWART